MSAIVMKAEAQVRDLLSESLSGRFVYHDLQHTLYVHEACLELGKAMNLSEDDKEILELSALFHDVGYIKGAENHEEEGVLIAQAFLNGENYDPQKQQKVLDCIRVTLPESEPSNTIEEIIKDADLKNLSDEDYDSKAAALRLEWELTKQVKYNEIEWLEENIKFTQAQKYYTPVAQEFYGKKKKKNIKNLQKRLREVVKSADKPGNDTIAGNRSAQMMFKTALRNHIDLTSIADSKANMMLSISSLVITLAMPMLASNVQEHPYLIAPSGILMVTCVLTIIYATLATRPIKTLGSIPMESIRTGRGNLFFFGNFYKMKPDDFADGMNLMMQSEEALERVIKMDLYYLGRALGGKYNQLRVCYTIFMTGVTLTAIIFVLAFKFKWSFSI